MHEKVGGQTTLIDPTLEKVGGQLTPRPRASAVYGYKASLPDWVKLSSAMSDIRAP